MKNVVSELTSLIEKKMQELFDASPITNEFHNGDWMDESYYRRHILECVLRIRMNNQLDAFAIEQEVSRNLTLAKSLAYYLYDEIGHEDLFYSDLKKMGMTADEIDGSQPFMSTIALMDFLREAIRIDGAGPAVLWDWFLEVYSARYNRKITEKAALLIDAEITKGAESHLLTDETEDHEDLMEGMLSRVIKTQKDLIKAKNYLTMCIKFVGEYFEELANSASNPPKKA